MTQEFMDALVARNEGLTGSSSDDLTFVEREPMPYGQGHFNNQGWSWIHSQDIQAFNYTINTLANQQCRDRQSIALLTRDNIEMSQAMQNVLLDNKNLRNQLQRKCLKEEALSKLFKLYGNAYWGVLRNGDLRQITSFVFESVTMKIFDDLYGKKPIVWIEFSNQTKASIDAEVFLNDKKFLLWLENVTHTRIEQYATQTKTAWLLRSIATQMMKTEFCPYNGGWIFLESKERCCYVTTKEFRTGPDYAKKDAVQFSEVHSNVNGYARSAALNYLDSLSGLRSGVRTICALWMHAAFLATLLIEWNFRLSKVLVISDRNATHQRYLKRLFAFGCELPVITEPEELPQAIVSQKDQPMVILDVSGGRNGYKNKEFLRQTMLNGTVNLQRKSKMLQRPLWTLPVLLSDGRVSLLGSECVIPLLITQDDFDSGKCAEIAATEIDLTEYFSNFVAYTASHIRELKKCLKESQERALKDATDNDLPEDCVDMLCILDGVASFLKQYYNDISLDPTAVDEIINDRWKDRLLEAMVEAVMESEAPDGQIDIFVDAAHNAVEKKHISICHAGSEMPQMLQGVLYWDENSYSFDAIAFETICHDAGLYPPSVKREMEKEGVFYGAASNKTTYKRQISILLSGGLKSKITVYKFKRSLLDRPGEPSLIEGWRKA